MYRHIFRGLFFVLLLLGFCLYSIIPLQDKVNLGLDLKGGTLLQYRLNLTGIRQDQVATAVEQVKTTVYKRLDRYGLKEIEVRIVGRDSIQVAVPGVTGAEIKKIKTQISTAGKMTIRLVHKEKNDFGSKGRLIGAKEEEITKLNQEWNKYNRELEEWNQKVVELSEQAAGEPPREPDAVVCVEYEQEETTNEQGQKVFTPKIDEETKEPVVERTVILHNDPGKCLDGKYVKSARQMFDPETFGQAVSFELKGEGAPLFEDLTGNHIDDWLAIEVDGSIASVATINDAISSRGKISGKFSLEQAVSLANILSVGSLKAEPKLTQEQVIGSRLGRESINRGTMAVIIGFVFVILFMALYYLKAGIIADFALIFNLILIMAYVCIFRQTLTFPGIAGVLLTVGMSVDANILIFERIREELKKGKGLVSSISSGYKRAFWTIFDANATTFITGLVLFKVGSGPIQGFAITLMAGLVANFVTSLYISRLFMSILYSMGLLKKLNMFEAFTTPNIPFVKNRMKFAMLSVVVITCGLGFFIWRGRDCIGIDFRGGVEIQVNLKQPLAMSEFKGYLEKSDESATLFGEAEVQAVGSTAVDEGAPGYILRVPYKQVQQASAAEPVAGEADPKKETAPAGEAAPAAAGGEASPASAPPAPAGAAVPAAGGQPVGNPAQPGTAPQPAKTTAQPAGKASGPAGGDADTLKNRYRQVLETVLSAVLAPPAFPVQEERDYPYNPDQKINVLQVNLFKGDIQVDKLKQFEALLPEWLNTYIELENKKSTTEEKLGLKGIGKFSINTVKVEKSPQEAYIACTVETAPIAYEEDDTPEGSEQVLLMLQQFFQSDFYKRNLEDHYLAELDKEAGQQGSVTVPDYRQLLPSEPFPRISMVDSAVAEEFQGSAMMAILVSLLAIVFYIGIRFELTFGIGAVAALIHDVLFGLGALAVVDYALGSFFSVKIDLPVIAAFLTIIGYSLNDTIVVFDRIRENMRETKKWVLEDVVNASINQTLTRTIWTSFTTFVVVFVLMVWGGETVQGFSFVMLTGVVIGTYSSIFIASPTMIYYYYRRKRKHEENVSREQGPSKKKRR